MSGPLSTPNGDVRIIRGHINEEFVCEKHSKCQFDSDSCNVVPLRTYLAQHGRLVTGKTRR